MNRAVDVRALVSHIVRGDGVDRCRICMGETSQGQVFLEDTVMLDGERPVTLAELLESLTGLEVELSKSLPVSVCKKCATEALAVEKFLDLCRKSEHQWTLYTNCLDKLGPTEDRAGLYVISNGSAEPILMTDKRQPGLNKEDIIKRISSMQLYKIRKKKRSINVRQPKTFSCPECDYTFYDRQRLNKHMRFMQKKCCRYCNMIVSFSDLEAHYLAHQMPVYHCKSCPDLFDCSQELETHMKVHEGFIHKCEECDTTFKTANELSSHIETHKIFPCPTCNKLFSTMNCFTIHQNKCTSEDKPDEYNKCRDCDTIFIDLEELNRHILENGFKVCCYCHTTVFADHFEKHVKLHDDEISVCPHCLEVYDDSTEFELHIEHHDETVRCKICNDETTSKLALLTHMKYFHSSTCGKCQRVFTSRDCYEQHVLICTSRIKKEHEYIKGIECPSCEQVFACISKLRLHLKESRLRICYVCHSVVAMTEMRRHMASHPVKFYSCSDCGDIFLHEKKLIKHMDVMHKPYQYKCIECHRTFESPYGLNMHVTGHGKNVCACGTKFDTRGCFLYHRSRCEEYNNAKAATYICDYCKADFKMKYTLLAHIKLKHLNSHRHICSTCGKRLNNYMHLLEHEATHKPVRSRYVCNICSLKMTSRRGYQKHMMKHNGRNFKCEHCDRAFSNPGQRTAHISRIHPETIQIFPCTICKKIYTKLYNLNKHMRDRHICD